MSRNPPMSVEAAQKADKYAKDTIEKLPDFDLERPEMLEALYGNFGFAEHYRKIVLASCKEIMRARAVIAGSPITEDRAEDLARLHPNYLDFLATHLDGRRRRERGVLGNMGA